MPPLRRSTSRQSSSGSSVNASSGSAGSRIQSSLRELVLELSGAPARVAGEHAAAGRRRNDLLRLVERREAERAEERHGGVVGVDELAEHEHRVRLHGAAEPDLLAVVDERLELRHELGHRRAARAG